jgi:ABC-type nitrate/sulfonate/bicarbonate transport system substrate-binding protein
MREEMAFNQKDVALKVVKGLITAADWITANPQEAARVANEVLKAPSVEGLAQQIQQFSWPGDFRKKVYSQQISIAEWGVGVGLFPSKDAKKLVDDLMYPTLIKQASPNRTDF